MHKETWVAHILQTRDVQHRQFFANNDDCIYQLLPTINVKNATLWVKLFFALPQSHYNICKN